MIKRLILLLVLLFVSVPAHGGGQDWWHMPEAEGIPFDPTGSSLTSEQVGPALRELDERIDQSASPGFTWGKSGSVSSAWLLNDSVPSNLAGRIVPVDGEIVEVFVANEDANTFTVSVYERSGASFVLILSISLTSQRTKIQSYTTSNAVDKGDELAVKVTSGSAKNPVVGLVIKGEF